MKKFEQVVTVNKTLLLAFVILIICIFISLFHVFDIKNVYKKQAVDNYMDIISVATMTLDKECSEIRTACTQMGHELSTYSMEASDFSKDFRALTEEYKEYEIVFYTPENEYYSEDVIFLDNHSKDYAFYSDLSSSLFSSNFTSRIDKVYTESTEECIELKGIYRFKPNENGHYSYLVFSKDITYVMSENVYRYINEIASCCIVDSGGNIIIRSSDFNDKMGEFHDNVFDALIAVSNNHIFEKNKIKNVAMKLGSGNAEDFVVYAPSGDKLYCYLKKIENAKGFYFFTCFDTGTVESEIAGGAIRSFLTCFCLIVILIGVSIAVWTIMRNSSELIEKLAYVDDVTGGWNFNYFKKKAKEIIAANRESHFIMCRFDIMNFRYINEAYGHKKADDVLVACVQEFKKYFSNHELCVRVNSDQFLALVLNDLELNNRLQRYSKAVGDRAKMSGVRYPIRFKSGFYQIKKEDMDIDVMIDHANVARKSIKSDNKIMEAFYSESIVSDMKKVDTIESEMQISLGKEEFRVFLQPKWDIVNDCVIGAEALVRWIKDDGTVIYPNDFIPVFEQNGFVEKLDFYMLEKICAKLKELRKKGGYKIVPISVNQSRLLINNPDYVKSVERVLERYETDVHNIELEITETVFFDEKDKMIEVVNQLKELGLTLAMDDFGSGYSSLNILKDIPFDIMKIDKEFFNEAATSEVSVIIMQKIIEMSEALDINVICEGVETEEQVDMLRNIGCKAVQGYFYGKPIPMDEFIEKYLKEE